MPDKGILFVSIINLLYHFILGPSAVGFEEDGHFSGHAAGGHDIPVSTTFAAE